MKTRGLLFLVVLTAIILSFGRDLNPFSKVMFEFHDQTQAARVQQFTLSLKTLKIPPRVAQDFYFRLGYPVFNFYAPTAYWITSTLNLVGLDVVNSLKISFLLALAITFAFSFLFLRSFFDYFPSLIGAVSYTTALYIPADIFVRGNLAEVWFVALLPFSLYFIYKNSRKTNPLNFIIGVIVLSLTFTSHNLLSLIFIPICLIFALLLNNKKLNLFSIAIALLMAGYFLIPLILENHLTIATSMAEKTSYQDNFLCLGQLWESPWGFGGSIPGCADGMSFKLGKLQIIFAALGIALFLFKLKKIKDSPYHVTALFYLILSVLSLFMTSYFSKPIWDLFSPLLAVFQFPWRFISFSLIGLAIFTAIFWQLIKLPFKSLIITLFVIVMVIINIRYFKGQNIAKSDYEEKYLSKKYIEERAAFMIPEYFSSFSYEKNIGQGKTKWGTTPTEIVANLVTLFTFAFLGLLYFNKPLWKKLAN